MTRVRVIDDLDSVLATIEAEDIHVIFREPLHESAEKLLRTLGVTWSYETHAPVLGVTHDPQDRGRKREYTPEQKARRAEKRRRHRQRKREQSQ